MVGNQNRVAFWKRGGRPPSIPVHPPLCANGLLEPFCKNVVLVFLEHYGSLFQTTLRSF